MEDTITREQARAVANTIYAMVNNDKLLQVPQHYHIPVFSMRGTPSKAGIDDITRAVMRDFERGDRKILQIFSSLKARGKV